MKKFFSAALFLFAAITYTTAQTADAAPAPDPNAPKFKWSTDVYDFGTIPQAVPATCKYEFVNEGKSPLIINDVQRTCGCTNTDWTKEPIKPGEKGWITATYSAANEGAFTKAITVVSNADTPNVKLTFKGTVVKQGDQNSGTAPENKTIFNSGNGGN